MKYFTIALVTILSLFACSDGDNQSPDKALIHMSLLEGDPHFCPATFTATEDLHSPGQNDDDECVIVEEIPGQFVHHLCSIPGQPNCYGEIIIRMTDSNEATTRIAVACDNEVVVCYYRSVVVFDKLMSVDSKSDIASVMSSMAGD
jgi:hypothetical protein